MGHYDEQYEAMEEASRKRQAARLKKAKTIYPNDPSEWGISNDERIKLLEDRVLALEQHVRIDW